MLAPWSLLPGTLSSLLALCDRSPFTGGVNVELLWVIVGSNKPAAVQDRGIHSKPECVKNQNKARMTANSYAQANMGAGTSSGKIMA